MNTNDTTTSNRQAAINSLAVVGFIALVAFGMWLAVYSARYVPSAVGRIGAAAVALGSVFVPASSPGIAVVPTASTTIPFGGGATSTPATTTPAVTPSKPSTPVATTPTAGPKTGGTYTLGSGNGTATLYGFSDLIVQINAVGYLTSSSTDSFVAATVVPRGSNPAVKFTVKNVGTNTTGGPWRFSASIPTSSNPIYQSIPQQSLNPGDYIEFTLGFSQANPGSNQTISVTANYDHAVSESNTNNNSAAGQLTILGS